MKPLTLVTVLSALISLACIAAEVEAKPKFKNLGSGKNLLARSLGFKNGRSRGSSLGRALGGHPVHGYNHPGHGLTHPVYGLGGKKNGLAN